MPVASLPTGIDLYYESHGEGEPLVFIPATGFSAEVWKPFQVPALSQSLQVVIHDPRGCGRSSHVDEPCTIEQMACDVVGLLDEVGLESAHVVGHSMGGRIGLALALNFPRRVKSLILAASGSGPAARSGYDCIPGLPFYLVVDLIEKGFESCIRHEICDSETYFTSGFRASCPDRVRAFYDVAWPTHARLPDYLQLCIARHQFEATHRLGTLKVPTLVVIGDGDVIGSNHVTQSEVLANRIPGAEYKVLEDQSHGFFWEVPEETNAWIVSWIENQS